MPPRIIAASGLISNSVENDQEIKANIKNRPPKIKQEIVPANPTVAIITILTVSVKCVLGSFVPEFFNFDQIKVRTKL